VDVDPVVREEILAVDDERDGQEVSVAEAVRRLAHLGRGRGGLALGLLLGGYKFTVTAEDPKPAVKTVRLRVSGEYADLLARAKALASAAALARDLANTPSNVKSPAWLAETTAKVAGPGVDVTIRDEHWLAGEGFGGVLAVGGGSARPPRLIELAYRPSGASAHLLLVGKGITFDTGGLSIKPADGMHLMRTDMAGGAAVIAAVRAIAQLALPVRVTALVPTAENHVSGSSYRPGDIVRHYGGRTTEVTNTDAEGRMVQAGRRDRHGHSHRRHEDLPRSAYRRPVRLRRRPRGSRPRGGRASRRGLVADAFGRRLRRVRPGRAG